MRAGFNVTHRAEFNGTLVEPLRPPVRPVAVKCTLKFLLLLFTMAKVHFTGIGQTGGPRTPNRVSLKITRQDESNNTSFKALGLRVTKLGPTP